MPANDNLLTRKANAAWSAGIKRRMRRADGYIHALDRVAAWTTAIVILGLIAIGMQA